VDEEKDVVEQEEEDPCRPITRARAGGWVANLNGGPALAEDTFQEMSYGEGRKCGTKVI
jgi:hypothetical protein